MNLDFIENFCLFQQVHAYHKVYMHITKCTCTSQSVHFKMLSENHNTMKFSTYYNFSHIIRNFVYDIIIDIMSKKKNVDVFIVNPFLAKTESDLPLPKL